VEFGGVGQPGDGDQFSAGGQPVVGSPGRLVDESGAAEGVPPLDPDGELESASARDCAGSRTGTLAEPAGGPSGGVASAGRGSPIHTSPSQ
jgi:hypothetical protein